jgi:tight adherence protein C
MAMAIPLLYFLLAITGIILFTRGIGMVAASAQLDSRVDRITLSARPIGSRKVAIPSILAARGKDRREIVENLQQAGYQGTGAIDSFLWIRLGATLGSLALTAVISRLVWGEFLAKPIALLVVPALVYLAAKRALLLAAGARQRAIIAEFPFLLDLMLMLLESGVSLDQCFRSIARDEASTAPRLNPSLRALVEDIDRGMNYEVALDRWAARVGVPSSKDLAALFQQGLLQGIELSGALRQFIREFTERRVVASREAMGKITVKLVAVMVLFFMPALFIVIAGPPVVTLMDTIGGDGK